MLLSSNISLVHAQTLSSVSLSGSSAVGGNTVTGTVTLVANAPAGGTVVTLSSNQTQATVPANVTVAAGTKTKTFTVSSVPVASDVAATISATLSSVVKTAPFTVLAPVISTVTFSASVTGGGSVTGTATLTGNTATGGKVVTLSSNQTQATVPASVTVAVGVKTATFSISTIPVSSAVTATITATTGATSKTQNLVVNPAALSTLALSPTSVNGNVTSTGTVTLNGNAASGGTVVSLSSNNAAVTVPATVTVAAGNPSVTFTANTSSVPANVTATVTATLAAVTKTANLTVKAPIPSTLSLSPNQVRGGDSSTGTITLNIVAPTGGLPVTLSSNNAAATVPASVTVPAGLNTKTFTISTVPASATATISAVANGTTKTANLTVKPPPAPDFYAEGGDQKVRLSVNSVERASSYNIKRGSSSSGPFTLVTNIADVPDAQLRYENTGLTNGTTYYYVVSTVDHGIEGPNSAAQSAIPNAATPPSSLLAKSYGGYVEVTFNLTGQYNYAQIYRGTKSGGPYTLLDTTASNTFIDKTCIPEQTYYYVATKTLGVAESAYSNESSAMARTVEPPQISVTAQDGQVSVTFGHSFYNSSSDLSFPPNALGDRYYNLFQATNPAGPFSSVGGGYLVNSTTTTFTGTTSHLDTGLTNGTTYYYYVSESTVPDYNTVIVAPNSQILGATPSGAFLNPPANLMATIQGYSVRLSWAAGNTVVGYDVKRSKVSGGPYTIIGQPTKNYFTDTDIISGNGTYYYVVEAKNAIGTLSGNSNEAQAAFTTDVISATTSGWTIGTPIQSDGIAWPPASSTVAGGSETILSAYGASDSDLYTVVYSDGSSTSAAVTDSCSYSWAATGGTFKNSVTNGRSVTWIAPVTPGTYTLTLTVDDSQNNNKTLAEANTRYDTPLQFTVAINVL